jgi:hypothetical protein
MSRSEESKKEEMHFQKVESYRLRILDLITKEGEESFKKKIVAEKLPCHPEAGPLYIHLFINPITIKK